MQTQNLHRIRKQTIEISFESSGDSTGLQNQVAEVFYEKLQPRMEVLFDEMFGEKAHASIDRLEIDCGLLSKKNWEQEFADQAIRKIKEELIQVNTQERDPEKIKETAVNEAFFFYLENGFMPWNNRFNTIAELEELLIINEKLVNRLKSVISQKSKAPERLVLQFSKNFTSRIIEEISKDRQETLKEIFVILEDLNLLQTDKHSYRNIDNHIVDAAILNLFSSDQNRDRVDQFFTFLLTKIDGNAELKAEIKDIVNYLKDNITPDDELKPEQDNNTPVDELKSEQDVKAEKQGSDIVENEAIYISNAGLVLVHPFLHSLFEQLELTKENTWIDRPSQLQAVVVSEFIVTGSNEFEEFNLMLNKILCGIDLEENVITEIVINDQIREECEVLLNEVITHWSVLRNTSIEGLRETFLQRSGKLSKVDNGWLLQVEQKPVDVLLNNLPWGIGIVKLPWMSEMLYVEWT